MFPRELQCSRRHRSTWTTTTLLSPDRQDINTSSNLSAVKAAETAHAVSVRPTLHWPLTFTESRNGSNCDELEHSTVQTAELMVMGRIHPWVELGWVKDDTIRYDTIGEFNVDSKAEYSALSSTRNQKKKLKQTTPVPL